MEDGKGEDGFRVAIIGAGVSGLGACKHFSEQGFHVTVFEEKSRLGGIWRATYPSTRLQTNKSNYEYSDFPWPESMPCFPSHEQVVDYLESYATHFKLFEKIRFNSRVIEAKRIRKTENSQNMRTSDIIFHKIELDMKTPKSALEQRTGEGGEQLAESLIGISNTRSNEIALNMDTPKSVPDRRAGEGDEQLAERAGEGGEQLAESLIGIPNTRSEEIALNMDTPKSVPDRRAGEGDEQLAERAGEGGEQLAEGLIGIPNTRSEEIALNMDTPKSVPDRRAGEEDEQLAEILMTESHNWGACSEESNHGHLVWELNIRKMVQDSASSADPIEEFGGVAKMPSFSDSEGPDVFEGQVLHSLHYSNLDSDKAKELILGKKIVIVGYRKTSLDLAVEAADINHGGYTKQPCTLLFRRTHWFFPRDLKVFGLFSPSYLWATRLSMYWTPKPRQGWVQNVLQLLFGFLRLLVWKLLEYYLQYSIPMGRFGLVPEYSLLEGVSSCILPEMPEDLFVHIQAGNIVPRKTTDWHFYTKGVRLADGTDIEADVVILCTGYDGPSKLKSIFPEEYKGVICEPEGLITLYRGIIHPRIPNVAFLGYQVGLSSVQLSEMGAVWLTQLLRQKFVLPDIETMEKERRTWLQHMKSTARFFSGYCVSTTQLWHTDNLCKDMGAKFLRKKTWWQEMFSIYRNADYRNVLLAS